MGCKPVPSQGNERTKGMSKHEWVAIFTLHLTDKEAAQAYTFDSHVQVLDKPCKGEA
jgi:hypothetical protein